MRRRAGGNLINLLGNGFGDFPRTGGAGADEPDALVTQVIEVVDHEDVFVGVDRALHRGLLDRCKLWLTLKVDGRRLRLFLVHASHLRNLREQYGFSGFVGAGNGRQYS